jgi:hypothetical protein
VPLPVVVLEIVLVGCLHGRAHEVESSVPGGRTEAHEHSVWTVRGTW